AIIVTIMVLELRMPAEPTLNALLKVAPSLVSYELSFLIVAIMWVNHHHMTHAVRKVTASLLWLNINLLFWMSLLPFTTEFRGKNHNQPFPVACYGASLAFCALAFTLLRAELIAQHRDSGQSDYHASMKRKNALSLALYLASIPLAYVTVYASYAIFV